LQKLRFKIAAPPGVSLGETRKMYLLLEVDASLQASITHQGEAAGACVEAQIDELRIGDAADATQPLRLTARSLAAPSQTLDPPAQYKLLARLVSFDRYEDGQLIGVLDKHFELESCGSAIGSGASTNATASVRLAQVYVSSPVPAPDGVALQPCPSPPWPKARNQYLFDDPISASLGCVGVGSTLLEYLRSAAQWSLQRIPAPLVPSAPNATGGSGNTFTVFPQHQTGYPMELGMRYDDPPVSGLRFETTNGLPASNSAFGLNAVNVAVGGLNFSSPIALFYDAAATNHPAGGPPGHVVNTGIDVGTIATPNWFYYYSQAWPPPCPIAYWDRDYSEYDYRQDHVHIGSPAHGPSYGFRPLFEMRSGVMTWVGYYKCYGIDAFARVVTHECKHKEIYDEHHQSISDAENDNVPDKVVDANGDPVLDANGNMQANDPNADPDDDTLPTWYERTIGLDPMNPDTTGFIAGGWYDGDSEAIARYTENQIGATPPREADWANDGLNWGPIPGQCPDDRIKKFARDKVTPIT
jgi:hypothetical protein